MLSACEVSLAQMLLPCPQLALPDGTRIGAAAEAAAREDGWLVAEGRHAGKGGESLPTLLLARIDVADITCTHRSYSLLTTRYSLLTTRYCNTDYSLSLQQY